MAYVEVEFYPEYYECVLRFHFLHGSPRPIDVLKSIPAELPWPHEAVQVLAEIRNCTYTGAAAELYFIGKCNELMAHVLQMGKISMLGNPKDNDGIAAVTRYIDEHFRENFRQSTLTRFARMSPTKLKTLFRKTTGKTITEYLSEKRTREAIRMLISTGMSIDEISAGVGYETPTGFATSFKRRTGMSPTLYRKNMEFDRVDDPSGLPDIVF